MQSIWDRNSKIIMDFDANPSVIEVQSNKNLWLRYLSSIDESKKIVME